MMHKYNYLKPYYYNDLRKGLQKTTPAAIPSKVVRRSSDSIFRLNSLCPQPLDDDKCVQRSILSSTAGDLNERWQ